MFFKVPILAFTLTLTNLRQAAAQFDASYTLWSGSDCGSNDATAFTEQSSQIDYISTQDSECRGGSMRLLGYQQTGGQYVTYIDGSSIKDDCKLVFYNPPPDGETMDFDCASGTPQIFLTKDSGCKQVMLSDSFVFGFCCGDKCRNLEPFQKREGLPSRTARDISAVKRAPILNNQKRQGNCNFIKGDVEPKVMYTRAQKTGQAIDCRQGGDPCPISGTYEASKSVSHSTSNTDTLSASAGGGNAFFQVSASYGHEWTTTDETSTSDTFSQSYTVSIPPGSSGFLIFKGKMLCGEGGFEGDGCDAQLLDGGNTWCIPAMTRGATDGKPIPDGQWSVYTY